MFRLMLLFFIASFLSSCSVQDRGVQLINQGDFTNGCEISIEHANSDVRLMNNAGWCYEKGLGNTPQNTEIAIDYYVLAARWGQPNARANLVRLGKTPPEPDLLIQQQQIQALRAQAQNTKNIYAEALGKGFQSAGNLMQQMGQQRILEASRPPLRCQSYCAGGYCDTTCK